MARLAESSVVIALRDWQWWSGLIKKKNIGMFVSLSGNADKKFGDLKVGLKDRFYLFEAKSTWDSVPEEWERPKERGRKHAHCMLRGAIEELTNSAKSKSAKDIVGISLRGHHFLYADPSGKRPSLRIEPYLMGTLRAGGFAENVSQEPRRSRVEVLNLEAGLPWLKRVSVAVKARAQGDPSTLLFDVQDSWTLSQFFRSAAALISPKNIAWRPTGVTLGELDRYIQFLCNGKDEEISGVVATANGSFFAFCGSTGELEALVGELHVHLKSSSAPALKSKPKARI